MKNLIRLKNAIKLFKIDYHRVLTNLNLVLYIVYAYFFEFSSQDNLFNSFSITFTLKIFVLHNRWEKEVFHFFFTLLALFNVFSQ